jgi:hypothetical protein
MAALWPAINLGIASLEKYYNKTDNSAAHVILMCAYAYCRRILINFSHHHSSDLNPCIKDEYFRVAWTPNGQEQAHIVMEKMVSCVCIIFYVFAR